MWCDLEESVGSWTCDIFSFLFAWSLIGRGTFCWKPPSELDQFFQSYSNWKILKTIENKRNAVLLVAVCRNQCCRLQTDPTRSQHTYTFALIYLYYIILCMHVTCSGKLGNISHGLLSPSISGWNHQTVNLWSGIIGKYKEFIWGYSQSVIP